MPNYLIKPLPIKYNFMKYLSLLLITLFGNLAATAQSPQKMSYQAVIRNAANGLVVKAPVKMRISILQGNASGTAVYTEIHNPTTNENGLTSIEIGSGTPQNGSFTNISWSNGPYFIKTEVDPSNGSDFSIAGTTQLLSVPYALYANETNIKRNGDTISFGSLQLYIPGVKTFVSGIPAVIIKGQIWMDKNLDVTTYRNGDPIPEVKDSAGWTSRTTGAWCNFANNSDFGQTYGKLYNWFAATDPRGLCPTGWRLPTKNDFEILIRNTGGDSLSAISLREPGTTYWTTNTGNNSSGFSARAGSWRGGDGNFYYWVRTAGWWWTGTKEAGSTEWDLNYPWVFHIQDQGRARLDRDPYFRMPAGVSVRCIKE
jgi:uncharacterized protein (TIGR02145 family)